MPRVVLSEEEKGLITLARDVNKKRVALREAIAKRDEVVRKATEKVTEADAALLTAQEALAAAATGEVEQEA